MASDSTESRVLARQFPPNHKRSGFFMGETAVDRTASRNSIPRRVRQDGSRTREGTGDFSRGRAEGFDPYVALALVREHGPAFRERLEERAGSLPGFVRDELEAFITCGNLEHGFLVAQRRGCGDSLRVPFASKNDPRDASRELCAPHGLPRAGEQRRVLGTQRAGSRSRSDVRYGPAGQAASTWPIATRCRKNDSSPTS